MSDTQRKFATLHSIVENSRLAYICPECLEGFSRHDTLLNHLRKFDDDIHKGLLKRKEDDMKFLRCYRQALQSTIPSRQVPQGYACYKLDFVLEHYGKDDYSFDRPADLGNGGMSIMGTSACDYFMLEGTAEVEGHRPCGPHIEGQLEVPNHQLPTNIALSQGSLQAGCLRQFSYIQPSCPPVSRPESDYPIPLYFDVETNGYNHRVCRNGVSDDSCQYYMPHMILDTDEAQTDFSVSQ